jgi:hypothetical protein
VSDDGPGLATIRLHGAPVTETPAYHTDEDESRLSLADFGWLVAATTAQGAVWAGDGHGRTVFLGNRCDLEIEQHETKLARTPARKRKPSIARTIKQAERAGKRVTSITTPDGATLRFDEPMPDTANEWDEALSRGKH